MIGNELKKLLVYGALIIPVDSIDPWVQLQFSKIPSNQVSIKDKTMVVDVGSSASPLVFKIKEPIKATGFSFKLKIIGAMNATDNKSFEEDSFFRLGLVAAGDKTLGRFQRLIAADWVKKLFDLAPSGVGLDKIYFYNVAQSKEQLGKSRLHPKSDLMFESVIKIRDGDLLSHEEKFDKAKNIVAIWVSIDGDQTKSKYQTIIQELKIFTE